jgi:DNA-binding transcriptional ArsR family regulator
MGVLSLPDQVATMLAPPRLELLRLLGEPDSAAGLARRTGLPRQKVNYHVRELEKAGLVEVQEERRRGNCTEKVMRRTAQSWVLSPEILGELGEEAGVARDRFSAAYVMATAARTLKELGRLRELADRAGKRLPTLTLESEVRFASAAARDAFVKELSEAVARLIVRHHDAGAPEGRRFRLLVSAYPKVDGGLTKEETEKGGER